MAKKKSRPASMSTSTMLRPTGKHREAHENRDHEHQWRKEMHGGVGTKRNNVFLGERLDAVGDRLQ
jgi:hypothetical protein